MSDESHPCYPTVLWNDTTEVVIAAGDIWDFPFWNIRCRGSLAIFQKWLDEQTAKIPPEFRHAADFLIDSEDGYEGEHHETIKVSYWRPMTPEEINLRDMERQAHQVRSEADLRAQYERLRKHFEPKP